MSRNFLVVDPEEDMDVLKGLASPIRVKILKLLHVEGAMNGNDIADKLSLPQSTVSTNIQILESAGLIRTETQKARKGNQKICHSMFDEVMVMFKEDIKPLAANTIEVAMPLGLYTSCDGAVRPVFHGRDYRTAGCARYVSGSRPDEGRADLVHTRLSRIPVSQ